MSSSFFMSSIDEEILSNSILSATISPKPCTLVPNPSKAKDKPLNLPVTFHTKIKSSGYGQGPKTTFDRMMLKKQQSNKRRQLQLQLEKSRSSGSISNQKAGKLVELNGPIVGSRPLSYDIDAECPTLSQDHLLYKRASSSAPSPILKIVFNKLGSRIATVTNDSSVNTFPVNASRRGSEERFYLGHNGRITDIEYSLANSLLLSSSADGTAKLWQSSRTDCAGLTLSHTLRPPSIMSTPSSLSSSKMVETRNKPFASEVIACRFYYMDKFILVAVKSSIYMYVYDLEDFDEVDDLNRLASRGRYELVHQWDLPCQSITTMSCVNTIQSPIILVATSDKGLYVLDAIRGEISQSLDCCHERPIHSIALPQPSAHVPLSPSTPEYNLFATSAIDNVISLWDIRTPQVVMSYSNHVNRREAIGCSISPCLRFLATGSEDNSCRIVDLRNASNELYRLTGHRDVVMDVKWHPTQTQIASASLDGTVRFYMSNADAIESTTSTKSTRRHRLANI